MLYRDAGQFKTSYGQDMAIFRVRQDRILFLVLLALAFGVVPWVTSAYWLGSIILPFLIFSLAALGLNILTGYAGLISLGTGGFMATGAFAAYKLATTFPDLHILLILPISGLIAALVGILFGLPSLRIKGFYLAVATLAAQFFLIWIFNKFPWFTNYSSSGVISAPAKALFGDVLVTGSRATPEARYLFVLALTTVLAWGAKNLVRGNLGRQWMAIRDMDIAAEIIGVRIFAVKLRAFAISSFYCGVAGALWAFCHTGSVEPLAFDVNRSFQVLFMIIIGGMGSIAGSFLGAGFIVLLPIFLNLLPSSLGINMDTALLSHLEVMIFGALIIFFLIVEPHGLIRLWQIGRQKLRLWPFPY